MSRERIVVIALINYVEVVVAFAVLYAMNRDFAFAKTQGALHGPGDALYFSAISGLTVGYGDIVPTGASRTYVVAEVFTGMFLLAVLVGRMLGSMERIPELGEK